MPTTGVMDTDTSLQVNKGNNQNRVGKMMHTQPPGDVSVHKGNLPKSQCFNTTRCVLAISQLMAEMSCVITLAHDMQPMLIYEDVNATRHQIRKIF